jgi:hypothetical protein
MNKISPFLTALFVTAVLPALAAMPQGPQVTKPIRAWKTETMRTESGRFDHCIVKNMYNNGTLMMLGQNNEGTERLALQFPQDKMRANQHFDLTIQIDRKDVFPVEAVALNKQIMTINIPSALPDQMRKGQLLHLRGPNDEVIYTMDGMNGAVTALRDCVISQNSRNPAIQVVDDAAETKSSGTPTAKSAEKPAAQAITKPVQTASAAPSTPLIAAAREQAAAAPATQNSSKSGLSDLAHKLLYKPEKTIETAQEALLPPRWHAVFSRLDLLPEKLLPIQPSPLEQPLDYIWLRKNLFLGTKAKTVSANENLDQVAATYLRMLKARCDGSFVAEVSTIQNEKTLNMKLKLAETACSDGKKEDSIAALLFTENASSANVYFFETKATNGANAIKARNAAVDILTQ